MRCAPLVLIAVVAFVSSSLLALAAAEDKSDASAIGTLMAQLGKPLVSDPLQTAPAKPWKVAKGAWTAADGSLRGAERKEDNHGAVMRRPLAAKDFVIAFEFKLDGAKGSSLSINDAKGHNSRVSFNARGFVVRKDDHDHAGPDKAALLQKVATPIEPGKWHTLVVEIVGADMVATLDGKHTGFGSHEAINVKKANVGLTVAGESASFRHLRIWEATAKGDWPSTKSKLEAAKAKAAAKSSVIPGTRPHRKSDEQEKRVVAFRELAPRPGQLRYTSSVTTRAWVTLTSVDVSSTP